jgi:hypothetical protein
MSDVDSFLLRVSLCPIYLVGTITHHVKSYVAIDLVDRGSSDYFAQR